MNIIKPCLNLFLAYLVSELRGFLSRLVGVPSHRSFLAHVRLTEMLSTGLSLLHLLWCHALEGFHTVFVHVDGELVHEVLGLYVGSIRLQDVSVTTWVQILGLCGVHERGHLELVVRVKVLVTGVAVVIWLYPIFRKLIIPLSIIIILLRIPHIIIYLINTSTLL